MITVLNGFRFLFALIVPILGTVNETLLAMAIAFWEHFCPEKDFGVCIGAERLLYFFEDMANAFAIFFELIIIQSNIYQVLILEFICDLTVYNPTFEEFFCSTIPMRHQYIEQLIANETFSYIDQNVYDHIEQVAELIASFARLIVREGLDYVGRTLIFLIALGLIVVKYVLIGATIVTAFFLAVITGMIYSSFPPEVKFGFNTTTTFEEAYDIMQDKLVNQLLEIDTFDFYNKSAFPCPPGVCELYKSILIQVNETLHGIYLKVPIIFMWIDLVSCYAVDIRECGHKFGICELMFGYDKDNVDEGKQNGLIYTAVFKIVDLLISTPDYICILWNILKKGCGSASVRSATFKDPETIIDECCLTSLGDIGNGLVGGLYTGFTTTFLFPIFGIVSNIDCSLKLGNDQFETNDYAECFVYELLSLPRVVCEAIVKPESTSQCVCDTCPIDLETSNEINTLIKFLPIETKGVPCNTFGSPTKACCVGGENYRYWTDNCELIQGGRYKSIFWGIHSLIFYGDTSSLEGELPFKCEDPLGYIFFLLNQAVEISTKYFDIDFKSSLEKMVYYYEISEVYTPLFDLIEPFVNFNSMDFPYAYINFEKIGYESDLENWDVDPPVVNQMYREHRNLMYSLTTGCYGPHFLAYYYTSLYKKVRPPFLSVFGFWKPDVLSLPNYNSNQYVYPTIYDDYDFIEYMNTNYPATGGILQFRQAPHFYGIGIKTFELEEVVICPLYRKMKTFTTDFGFSEFDLGSEYMFLLYNSIIKELREVFFSYNINNALSGISYDTHEYKKRDKFIRQSTFEIYPQEIRPSVFYEILKQNKTTFLKLFVEPTELNDNEGAILSITKTFVDVIIPNIYTFCRVYTVDHGFDFFDSPTFKYRLNDNILYSDMGRSSFYNFYVSPYDDPQLPGQDPKRWIFERNGITLLDNCVNAIVYISQNLGITADFEDPNIRTDVITNELLNNSLLVQNITNGKYANRTFDYEEEFLEEISKQYMIVKVMKEKYFAMNFLNQILSNYLADGPCSTSVFDQVSFYEEQLNETLCEKNIPMFKLFFEYFIKHDPYGWYKLWIDNEEHPKNICMKKDVVELDVIGDITDYMTLDHDVNLPWIISDFLNDTKDYNYFATIVWNFIERLNEVTSYYLFENMDFDLEEASRFCAEAGVVYPRLGMELPKTECLLYMSALNVTEHADFAEDFFDPELTNCDIVSSFLTKVFNFGWKTRNGDYFTETVIRNIVIGVNRELDCNEIILERLEIQNQDSYVGTACGG